MESYDPRTPIVKATEAGSDEVTGHIRARDAEQPADIRARLSDEMKESEDVAGHIRARDAEQPADIRARLSDEMEESEDVTGHIRARDAE